VSLVPSVVTVRAVIGVAVIGVAVNGLAVVVISHPARTLNLR
jgi:hypothetical protein